MEEKEKYQQALNYIINNYKDWDYNVCAVHFDNKTLRLKDFCELFENELQQKYKRIAELENNLRELLDTVKNSNYKYVLEENISLGNALCGSTELTRKYMDKSAKFEKQLTEKGVNEYKETLIKNIIEAIRQDIIAGQFNKSFIAGEKEILKFIKGE